MSPVGQEPRTGSQAYRNLVLQKLGVKETCVGCQGFIKKQFEDSAMYLLLTQLVVVVFDDKVQFVRDNAETIMAATDDSIAQSQGVYGRRRETHEVGHLFLLVRKLAVLAPPVPCTDGFHEARHERVMLLSFVAHGRHIDSIQ